MNVIAAVALVGILVFIHEFGHFFFAKIFKVDVQIFSLGFGRRLFGFNHQGTDYRVSLLPIGGYVQMAGADPFMDGGDLSELESPGSFLKKPVWQRLLIVSAGPAFNLILPVVVFTGLYMGGEPQPAAVVGTVLPGSAAAAAGLQSGDRVVSLDGGAVTFWSELYERLPALKGADALELGVQRGEREWVVTLTPPELAEGDALGPYDLGLEYSKPDRYVGVDDPASPAGRAGLQSFDRISAVDGVEVASLEEILAALDGKPSAEIAYLRRVDGETVEASTTIEAGGWAAPALGFEDPRANDWGLYPGYLMIGEILEDSAATRANLLVGDRLAGIDGAGLISWSEVTSRIGAKQVGEGRESSAVPVTMTLVRDGRVIEETVTPKVVKDTDALGRYRYRAMVGIGAGGGTIGGPDDRRHYPFVEALPRASRETATMAGFVVEQVGKLITGEAAPSKTLGGPIQIFRDAGAAAADGIYSWARMMGLLSISLGIINFLPVPVLDGGQFLFYAVEGIRGRPLSLAIRERAQQIGVLFLVALMFSVLVFDVNRWING